MHPSPRTSRNHNKVFSAMALHVPLKWVTHSLAHLHPSLAPQPTHHHSNQWLRRYCLRRQVRQPRRLLSIPVPLLLRPSYLIRPRALTPHMDSLRLRHPNRLLQRPNLRRQRLRPLRLPVHPRITRLRGPLTTIRCISNSRQRRRRPERHRRHLRRQGRRPPPPPHPSPTIRKHGRSILSNSKQLGNQQQRNLHHKLPQQLRPVSPIIQRRGQSTTKQWANISNTTSSSARNNSARNELFFNERYLKQLAFLS